jgi:hypothetical protein
MVLLQEEVPGALAELKRQSFKVEALLGPFLKGSPAVQCLYFSGKGPQGKVGGSLKVLGKFMARYPPRAVKTSSPSLPRRTIPTPTLTPDPLKGTELMWSQVEAILGRGERSGKLLNYVIPRGKPVLKEGVEISAPMGMATEFHFQKVEGLVMGEKRSLGLPPKAIQPVVATTGHFALTLEEVEPVRACLTRRKVTLMEVQEHLSGESPRLSFLDFWFVGRPDEAALVLKEALEKVGGLNSVSFQTQSP